MGEHWIEFTDRIAPELVHDWLNINKKIVLDARAEGWFSHLERILKTQSRLAAQRQHQIENGAVMDPLKIDVPYEQLKKMQENLAQKSIIPPNVSKFGNKQIRDLSKDERKEFFDIMHEAYPDTFQGCYDMVEGE